jgi:hypothetical protein
MKLPGGPIQISAQVCKNTQWQSALQKTGIGSQDLNLLNDREYNNKLRIWRRISLCFCRSASSTLQGLFCLHFKNVFKEFWSVQQLAVESLHPLCSFQCDASLVRWPVL